MYEWPASNAAMAYSELAGRAGAQPLPAAQGCRHGDAACGLSSSAAPVPPRSAAERRIDRRLGRGHVDHHQMGELFGADELGHVAAQPGDGLAGRFVAAADRRRPARRSSRRRRGSCPAGCGASISSNSSRHCSTMLGRAGWRLSRAIRTGFVDQRHAADLVPGNDELVPVGQPEPLELRQLADQPHRTDEPPLQGRQTKDGRRRHAPLGADQPDTHPRIRHNGPLSGKTAAASTAVGGRRLPPLDDPPGGLQRLPRCRCGRSRRAGRA